MTKSKQGRDEQASWEGARCMQMSNADKKSML